MSPASPRVLEGKVAVVTGAFRGKYISLAFDREDNRS